METLWHPGELLSVSSGYWRGCALQAGVRLKIFTGLADGRCRVAELAKRLGADEYALNLLLDALAAMKLLSKNDDQFSNCPEAQRFLVESSPQYMGHILLHHHHLLDGWAQLDEAVKTGGAIKRRSYGEDVERESFLMGMFNLAMLVAPQVAEQFDLGRRTRLLDLGGGPGTYAIHFCKANPELHAVIYDRPTTEPFARETVAKFALSERIEFHPGDFTRDPIDGGPYDVAWLSHILHSNPLEKCYELVKKTVAAMQPGGVLIIHDFILDNTKDGPEFPALFSLNMLLANNGGRSYSELEIFDMMRAAGVRDPKRHVFQAKNDSAIVYGSIG